MSLPASGASAAVGHFLRRATMDRLQAMQVFTRVVDTNSFTKAAETLDLPRASVTTIIQNLESHLGVRLMHRTTRRLSLTPDGAAYYERCVRILADVEEAEIAAEGERARPSGRLVVSAPVGFGRLHVSPVMNVYLKRHREVSAELRLQDRMVNLVEEGADLAVRIGHLADSSLVARHVGDMRRIVVASPGYLKSRGEPKRPQDIAAHDTIQFGSNPASTGWRFVEGGKEIRLDYAPRLSTNSADAAIQYAEAGGGLTRVLAYQATDAIKRGRLKVVLTKFGLPPLPIHVVYPTSRLLSAKVRTFIDLVVEISDWHFG